MNVVNHIGTALQCANAVASCIELDLRHALEHREHVVFLASGGRSPGPILSKLSKADLDWSRVIISLTDERQVPIEHDDSNANLVNRKLLRNTAAASKFIPLWQAEDKIAIDALTRLDVQLGTHVPFDVALIGMGMDGHTASIFPNGEGMSEAINGSALFSSTTPNPLPQEAPWARITCTISTLAATKAIHLILFDEKKKELFKTISANPYDKSAMASLIKSSVNPLTIHTTSK